MRQENVMTLASDYLLTSNSVIGPNGGFHFYQNDYLDRLQEKIVHMQEEVDV